MLPNGAQTARAVRAVEIVSDARKVDVVHVHPFVAVVALVEFWEGDERIKELK